MTALRQLGTGWSFPVRPEQAGGGLAYRDGPEKVRQAIELILDTEPGERIMRPTFGCGLRRFLMQPNSVATRALITREVETALTIWEPRIQLREVQVLPGDDPALVYVSIAYLHVRDRRPGNLVYPFYLA
jgi:phage baseplate assembly protein W